VFDLAQHGVSVNSGQRHLQLRLIRLRQRQEFLRQLGEPRGLPLCDLDVRLLFGRVRLLQFEVRPQDSQRVPEPGRGALAQDQAGAGAVGMQLA
jgi:hypothetical protein